jgi:hypothetical protein
MAEAYRCPATSTRFCFVAAPAAAATLPLGVRRHVKQKPIRGVERESMAGRGCKRPRTDRDRSALPAPLRALRDVVERAIASWSIAQAA